MADVISSWGMEDLNSLSSVPDSLLFLSGVT